MAMLAVSRPLRDRAIACWREKPVGEPCAGNSHARFDEREVETEHALCANMTETLAPLFITVEGQEGISHGKDHE
jgi:hypothetical protein